MPKKKEATPIIWLSTDEKTYLNQFDSDTLADWWAHLNGSKLSCDGSRRWAIMSWIFNNVGHKECLRAWNVNRGNMTNEKFNEWYEGSGFSRD